MYSASDHDRRTLFKFAGANTGEVFNVQNSLLLERKRHTSFIQSCEASEKEESASVRQPGKSFTVESFHFVASSQTIRDS